MRDALGMDGEIPLGAIGAWPAPGEVARRGRGEARAPRPHLLMRCAGATYAVELGAVLEVFRGDARVEGERPQVRRGDRWLPLLEPSGRPAPAAGALFVALRSAVGRFAIATEEVFVETAVTACPLAAPCRSHPLVAGLVLRAGGGACALLDPDGLREGLSEESADAVRTSAASGATVLVVELAEGERVALPAAQVERVAAGACGFEVYGPEPSTRLTPRRVLGIREDVRVRSGGTRPEAVGRVRLEEGELDLLDLRRRLAPEGGVHGG